MNVLDASTAAGTVCPIHRGAARPAEGASDAPRPAAVDLPRIARAVREILIAIGEDPDREGLLDTPARVARAYRDLTAGLHEDAGRHLAVVFSEGAGDLVMVRDIEVHSLCEHHLLPFRGRAHVAYLPQPGRVVGLSKLARTVDVFARRLQVQERMTQEIADAIAGHLDARAVTVMVEAEHMCMQMRGAQQRGAVMTTVAHRGLYAHDLEERRDVLALLRGQ
jgi:GTP cyclohydrolase I